MEVRLTADVLEEMRRHARATYPDECCGLVIERAGAIELVRVNNIQNELHAQDPVQFPRLATTAYTMGPEAAPVLLDAELGKIVLHAIYHSHPKHGAYFSAEDRFQAKAGWDEPMYPDAGQIVLAVDDDGVNAIAAFRWDPAAGDYAEARLVVGEGEGEGAKG